MQLSAASDFSIAGVLIPGEKGSVCVVPGCVCVVPRRCCVALCGSPWRFCGSRRVAVQFPRSECAVPGA